MDSAYIALGYACNQRCTFCPCTEEDLMLSSIDIGRLKSIVDSLHENNVDLIVISGGEPTIHETFSELLKYIFDKKIRVNILSNSEQFGKSEFFDKVKGILKDQNVVVTTTIHSHLKDQHEKVNNTPGSFDRTIQGLKKLRTIGVNVIVKHCITALNRTDLKAFYEFIDDTFDENVSIQLCSIDYCGIGEQSLEENIIVYPKLKPYFETMFKEYISRCSQGKKRHVYCINIPLCACSSEYWQCFAGKPPAYKGYSSPQIRDNVNYNNQSDVGTFSDECKNCSVNDICAGTYRSAYELFGNRIFKAY